MNLLISAPIRAIGVKRHDGSDPVACVVSPGWPDCSSGSSSWLPGYVAVREGSSWSARSRAAARTNELDADERRTIMDSEEGSLRAGLWGVVVVPGVAGGVVSQAPIRRPAGVQAGAMTMCPGTGLLSQMMSAAWRPAHAARRACPGLSDLPGLRVRPRWCRRRWLPARRAGGRRESAACGRSRWWRSSSRGVSRCLSRWRRILATAWRSAPPG